MKNPLSAFINFVVIALVVLLTHGGAAFYSYAEERPSSIVALQPQDPELAEFYRQLDVQTALYFKEFESTIPAAEREYFVQIKNAVRLKFRQMDIAKKEILSYGKVVGFSLVAGEVVSTFIAPPVLAYMGLPQLAAISTATPVGLFTGGAAMQWKLVQLRWKTARELGLRSLRPLEKLHTELLGYDLKNRVTTLLYQNVAEVDVVTKAKSKAAAQSRAILEIVDIEELIRTSGPKGKAFLDAIFLDQVDNPLYVAKMLKYIQSDFNLITQFKSRIDAKLASQDPTVEKLRKTLLRLDDLNNETVFFRTQVLNQWNEDKKGLKKSNEFSKQDVSTLNSQIKQQAEQLADLRNEIEKSKYTYLFEEYTRRKISVDDAQMPVRNFDEFYGNLKKRLRALRNETNLILQGELTNPSAVSALAAEIRKREPNESLWGSKQPGQSCKSALREFFHTLLRR